MGDAVIAICDLRAVPDGTVGSRVWHWRDGTAAGRPMWRHATLTTTDIYTRGDPTEKLDAMESIVPPHLRRGVFQPSDKLIALLQRTS
jgi:hypothetical protein